MIDKTERAPRAATRDARDLRHSTRTEQPQHSPLSMLPAQLRRIATGRGSLDNVAADTLRLRAIYGTAAVLGAIRSVAKEVRDGTR